LNARFVKPLDEDAIRRLAEGKKIVITAEEGTLIGGFGSAVTELFEKWKAAGAQNIPSVRTLGIPDQFIEHGKREVLLDGLGLSAEKMRDEVVRLLAPKRPSGTHL
jgi:1-deoxy-D-xylulose-5-phosphate synthase